MEAHNYKLTKNDYKVIRELLSVALEREFVQGLEQAEATIKAWRTDRPESARENYHKVLSDLKSHRKELARTYDDPSKFVSELNVIALIGKGVLTEADIPEQAKELKKYLLFKVEEWRS